MGRWGEYWVGEDMQLSKYKSSKIQMQWAWALYEKVNKVLGQNKEPLTKGASGLCRAEEVNCSELQREYIFQCFEINN